MAHLFPVYLDLRDRPCLVVGGGNVAYRKVCGLYECGARITVVAPQAEEGIGKLARDGQITWKERNFLASDVEGMILVICATDREALNKEIAGLCKRKGIQVNVVDDPPLCSFFVPSVLRRGSLTLAISTEGKSPLFARKLREQMEEMLSPEYGEFVELLGQAREKVKRAYPDDINQRRKAFEALVNSDILELLLSGQKERAKERVDECIFSLPG